MVLFMMLNMWANPNGEDWKTKTDYRNDETKKLMFDICDGIGMDKAVSVAFTIYYMNEGDT